MNGMVRHNRWIAVTVLAALLLASVATVAGADSRKKRDRRDREVRVVYRDSRPTSTYIVRRSSSAGPVIAGFLGGLFLGAALAHAAPAGYVYEDPYCGRRFHSLEIYHGHFVRHRHPGVIHVVALDHGDYVRSYRYTSGRWKAWDDHGTSYDRHRAWERERHFERRYRDWERDQHRECDHDHDHEWDRDRDWEDDD